MQSKIKIVKCSNPILWYNKFIGMEFPVQKEDGKAYWILEPDEMGWRLLNWVYKEDAEIL